MMTIKTLRLLQLLSYAVVASQMIFYLLILADAMRNIDIGTFMSTRRQVDPLMQARWKWIYYSCGALCIAATALTAKNPGSAAFLTSAIALLCLLADIVLALRGNGPINSAVNAANLSTDLSHWEPVRHQWIRLVEIRGLFTVAGLVSLLVGIVFGK